MDQDQADGRIAPAAGSPRSRELPGLLLVLGVYLALGLLAYLPVIVDGVFVIDDFDYIKNNPIIGDLRYFANNVAEARYVGYLTFALNYALGEFDPTGYHLANALVHVANSFLVFWITKTVLHRRPSRSRIGSASGPRAAGFLTGAVFLLHPLNTQAVSYVSQRFTSLCVLFYLGAVAGYLAFRLRRERGETSTGDLAVYVVSVVAALLAMKTKEIAFTLPASLLLLEATILRGSRFGTGRLAYLAPHVAVAAVVPLSLFSTALGLGSTQHNLFEAMLGAKHVDLFTLSPYVYLITQFGVLTRYLSLLFFPVGLRAEYEYVAAGSVTDPAVLLGFAVLVAMAAFGVWCWRRAIRSPTDSSGLWMLVAFGIGWFFVTSSVESSFIPIKHLIFEHRTYLPNVGLIQAVLALCWLLGNRLNVSRHVGAVCGAVLLLTLGIGTWQRNHVWTDELVFWSDVIEKSPGLLAGHHNRAVEHRNRGQLDLALADLDSAVSHFQGSFQRRTSWPDPDLNPENLAKVFGVRAKVLTELGRREEARKDYVQILALARIADDRPTVLTILLNVADAFRDGGHCGEALPLYASLLDIDPTNIDAWVDRGRCLLELGDAEPSVASFSRALDLNPMAAPVYYNRASALQQLGDEESARADLERSCQLGFQHACQVLAGISPDPGRP